MNNAKTTALSALAVLAAAVMLTNVANAAAVSATASISDRSGSLLDLSVANEYDIIATTKQQEYTHFGTVLPASFSLADSNGFSAAGISSDNDPFPSVSAGAHGSGAATSSIVWSFDYMATATGLATLDLEYTSIAQAINVAAGETALVSSLINIKRSGVSEAGSEVFNYFSLGNGDTEDIFNHLLYSFNATAGETGSFIVTLAAQSLTAPVPLPAAVWLLGSGLMGLGALRRKRIAVA